MSNPIALADPTAAAAQGITNLRGNEGAAHVVDAGPAYFRALVTPSLSASPTGPLKVDGVGTANLVPHYVLAVVNPGDDVTAATRLQNGNPECFFIRPGESLEIVSDTAITDVYFVAVDADSAAPLNYTGNAYIVTLADADLADWLANMAKLTFGSSDVVKKVVIAASDVYATNYMTVSVQGVSYA